MKNTFKRIISLALALVMIFGILPMDSIPTVTSGAVEAPTSISVTAMPAKIAVGQTSQLSVVDNNGNSVVLSAITFSSNNQSVATVNAAGVVTGVHSGNATITATYTGTTVSATVAIEVTATSYFDLSLKAFNVGNDTNGDGFADKFGNADSVQYDNNSIPVAKYNNWTDPAAIKFFNYYASNSSVDTPNVSGFNSTTAAWYRGRQGFWRMNLWNMTYGYDTYDYVNLNNSAPWTWKRGGFSGIDFQSNTFMTDSGLWVYTNTAVVDGAEPYVVLMVRVPSAGTYSVNVVLSESGKHNLHFYMPPRSAVSTSGTADQVRASFLNPEYYLGSMDSATTVNGTLSKEFVADTAGDYYFAVKFDNDGSQIPAASQYVLLKSLSLTMEEKTGPVLNAGTKKLILGQETTLSVTQKSSLEGEIPVTGVTYTADDDGAVVRIDPQADGTAKITALSAGTVKITASFEFEGQTCTDDVILTVSRQIVFNLSSSAFNFGNDTNGDGKPDEFSENDTWSDRDATHFIPWATTGTAGYGWDRGPAIGWYYYMIRSGYGVNLNPTYQNFANTAPWEWITSEGIKDNSVFSTTYATISYPAITNGAEPYIALKVNIPKSGEYTMSVDTGVASGTHNMYFYMVPAAEVTTIDRATLTNAQYAYGNIDLANRASSGTITATFDKKMVVDQAGDYYLVIKIDNDGINNTTPAEAYAYIKTVSLSLNECEGIYVVEETKNLEAGDTAQLTVMEQWTVGDPRPASGTLTFSSSNERVATVSASGMITALAQGSAEITVTMGEFTAKAYINVTSDDLISANISCKVEELGNGNKAQLSIKEQWSISGEKIGNATDYTFTTSNSAVATVDSNGFVTGVSSGKVTITATNKNNPSISGSVILVIIPGQVVGETMVLDYNFVTGSFNIGNDTNGDGVIDDFGDSANVANGLIPNTMFNTWTDKNAAFFVPYYATDANDGNKTNPDATTNGFAWARPREATWRLYPIWSNAAFANNQPYFSQYRYLNSANTALWQWTQYNAGINAQQTYLLSNYAMIRIATNDITDGNEPYVTLKLNVPAAGTYHFSVQSGGTGKANLYFYLIPVEDVADGNRENLTNSQNLVGTMDTMKETVVKYDNAVTVDKAGEYYLVIKVDNDNWTSGDPSYPKAASDWDVRIKSVTLTLDKQSGVDAIIEREKLRVGGSTKLIVRQIWAEEGLKLVKDPAAEGVVFSSSNTAVAKVDANGVITGTGDGTATITITQGSFSDTVQVTVLKDSYMKNIQIIANQTTLNVTRSMQLSVEEIWSIGGNDMVTNLADVISFSSSNSEIAAVDSNGKVTGHRIGNVTITATHKVTGLTAAFELEISGILNYNILSSSFNIANYDPLTGKYDFGDEDTKEPMLGWFEAKNMFNTWTDKNATKFIPFYAQDANDANSTNPAASSNGFAYARVREGLWRLYPIYATYSSNKEYFSTYDYLNGANTALWQWTPYNAGISNTQTYITQNFTYVSAGAFQDGNEPYVTLKLNIPVAGTYTVDVVSEGNTNQYYYLVPVSELGEVSRDTLIKDEYLVGAPHNAAKNKQVSYNGGFVAEEAGDYYFVIRMDNDNLLPDEEIPSTYTIWLNQITLTPDAYTGISITTPIQEIETGWFVDSTIRGVWQAGGLDEFSSYEGVISFQSSDPAVATVDANGRITGVKKGTAIITATELATGYKASVKIQVKGKGECKQDVYIYFNKASSNLFSEITIEKDGWAFNFDKSASSSAGGKVFSYGIYMTNRSVYNNAAIDVYVPHDGYYQLKLVATFRMNCTGRADIYIDGVHAGDIVYDAKSDMMSIFLDLRTIYLSTGVHTFNFVPREESGNSAPSNYNYICLDQLGLIPAEKMPEITNVTAKELFIAPGSMNIPTISVTTSDGFTFTTTTAPEEPYGYIQEPRVYKDKFISVKYKVLSGDDVVRVSEDGEVIAIKEGMALIGATIQYLDGQGKVITEKSVEVPVSVSKTGEDPRAKQLSKIEIVGSWYDKLGAYNQPVYNISLNRSATYYIRAINALGEEMELADAQYSWSVGSTTVVKPHADADSYLTLTAAKVGSSKVTVKVTVDGVTASTSFEVTTRKGKTGRSIYTDEMIQTARENIELYEWAQTTRDSAVVKAQRYMGLDFNTLWNAVTSQGLPRAYNVSFDNDPEMYYCRYCKENLYTTYGNYPYQCNPSSKQWKITCPECKHDFPTNDFGKFYELGRTVENNGKFDRITALEAHREMLIQKGLMSAEALALEGPGDVDRSEQWLIYYGYGVKGGYLYNQTCPNVETAADSKVTLTKGETVERWGVDDGMGYDTGRTWPSGAKEVYTFVAYYNHFATWFGLDNGLVVDAINYCSKAYLYTGDVRYGRVACILLDRVADVYPDLNLKPYTQYPNNDGGTNNGHATGRIWETLMAVVFPEAYDIVYPLFDDPEVLKFLNNQGQKWGYGDAKNSADKIRENIETGILREIFNACKDAEIMGNFGLHQSALAGAAVVLDTYPDTQEMINWLFQYSITDSRTYNTGGDINNRLVVYLYRDGQNYESPYYNEMGISNFGDTAAYLQMYQGYEGPSVYENAKYLALMNSFQLMTLIRRGTKAIGDANYAVHYTKYPNQTALQEAFYYLKDNEEVRPAVIKIAQHLYFLNNGLLEGIHYGIFTKNPDSFAADVQAFIDEYGEYDYDKSSILTGYGIGILRDGTLYDKGTRDGMLLDTTRDFTLNFSGHYGHNHSDLLDLGMEAFGLGMTTDLGYPETPNGGDPHSSQWSNNTIAHNTVVVDEQSQTSDSHVGYPMHFDAKDFRVKVMDAFADGAYKVTDEYRRTVVMINFNDDISYGVDFFRVLGGDDHMYTFMPTSEEHPLVSENIANKFVTQKGGTYAGADVPHGNDPHTGLDKLQAHPTGYTWMYDVDKALNPGANEFWFDYQIKDFRNVSRNDSDDGLDRIDVRLRITMLSDETPDEISLVSTTPQRVNSNKVIDHLEKFIVRRSGNNLDSLFTAVYEPYEEGEKYISSIDSSVLKVTVADGKPGVNDVVKAVRVKIDDGKGTIRYDYVIYANNTSVTYNVMDPERNVSFNFRGFVGVWSTNAEGTNIYTYINDGDYIGNATEGVESSYTYPTINGLIKDWQRELSTQNWLDVTFDTPITEEQAKALKDRMIDVERATPGNSCFMIEGVEYTLNADGMVESARLDLGTITTVSGYVDVKDISRGFTYDVFKDAKFVIRMSYEGGAMADYSVLDAEIAYYNSLKSSDFSVDSWLRYQLAIEKGIALSKDLRAIDQKVIDDIVAEIQSHKAALVSKVKPSKAAKADYSALDEEIAMMDVIDPALYTIESWDAYVAVWQEAVDLDRNLTEEDQQIIDDMVVKLKAAREALALRSNNYTLIIVLAAAFIVVLAAAITVIVVVKRRRKLEASAQEIPTQE